MSPKGKSHELAVMSRHASSHLSEIERLKNVVNLWVRFDLGRSNGYFTPSKHLIGSYPFRYLAFFFFFYIIINIYFLIEIQRETQTKYANGNKTTCFGMPLHSQ